MAEEGCCPLAEIHSNISPSSLLAIRRKITTTDVCRSDWKDRECTGGHGRRGQQIEETMKK